MFQSTRHLCNRGSQKGLPRALSTLWNPPENKYMLWLCSLESLVSWIPLTLPKIRNCCSYALSSSVFCLSWHLEKRPWTWCIQMFRLSLIFFFWTSSEDMRFCLLWCSDTKLFSLAPSCTQKFRGSLSLEGSNSWHHSYAILTSRCPGSTPVETGKAEVR